jgi:hypothetical protein
MVWPYREAAEARAVTRLRVEGRGRDLPDGQARRGGRGLGASTSQLDLSRVSHKKTPYTP